MRIVIANSSAAVAMAAFLSWPTSASALPDLAVNVNCDSGARISQALGRPTLVDRRLVVLVSGTCNENVTIERDDVTLRAQGFGGSVNAADAGQSAILINGARRVALEGLSVVGGLHGVHVVGGGSVAIRASGIHNAARNGVVVDSGAGASIDASTIENHGRTGVFVGGAGATMTGSIVRGNGFSGVSSAQGGRVTLGDTDAAGNVCCGNTIEGNALDGVTVADNAVAILYGNTIRGNGTSTGRFGVLAVEQSSVLLRGGNVVQGNGRVGTGGGGGIFARGGATIRTGSGDAPNSPSTNEISGNAFGIQASSNSHVDLRGGVNISRNTFTGVVVEQGSQLRMDIGTISNNGAHGLFVARGSAVDFFGGGVSVNGNGLFGLYCQDGESHYSGNVGGIMGNTAGDVSCTLYPPPPFVPPPGGLPPTIPPS